MIVKRNRGGKGPANPTPATRRIVKRGKTGQRSVAPSLPIRPQATATTRAVVRHHQPTIGGGVQPRRRRPTPRIHLRFRSPIRKRHLIAVGSLAVAGAALYGGSWLWQSPLMEVGHVEVSGNERVETETIVAQANVLGENILQADLASVERNLYALALVAKVHVIRDFPNTVKIVIEERKTWGTWEQGGIKYSIDRDGVVLGTIPSPLGAPVIRSADRYTLRLGDRVNYQAVDAAAEIYDRLPRQLGTTVAEVAFVPGKGVTVVTADGQTALLGDSSSISYKLAVWAAMATEAQKQRISYTSIDLRYGNRPVVQ